MVTPTLKFSELLPDEGTGNVLCSLGFINRNIINSTVKMQEVVEEVNFLRRNIVVIGSRAALTAVHHTELATLFVIGLEQSKQTHKDTLNQ